MNSLPGGAARHNGTVSARRPRDRDPASNRAPAASGAGDPHAITLAPIPGAPRAAREWVAAKLAGWPAPGVENASLVVSELVTNAVLHARTPIVLRCVPAVSRARLEVRDELGDAPMLKAHTSDSPTGRGLRLVASLSEEWGVSTAADAKVVWCVVDAYPAPTRLEQARRFTRAAASTDGGDVGPAGPGPAGAHEEGAHGGVDGVSVRVTLHGLPLGVFDEAGEHSDAVVRELALIAQSAGRVRGADVAHGLLELAEMVRADVTRAARPLREQVERARDAGADALDVELDVPVEHLETLVALAARFDELDRYCEEGELLTLASSPAHRRFRRWFADQLVRQAGGLSPVPWARGG